ncbi:mechanosensitive ion channel family protein [bacterium]|nr:mechanosensitive ion channel family protein [bacterium]
MKTKGIVSIIIKCVLGLVGLTLLVLILGRESFFTDDSFFYSLFDESSKLTAPEIILRSVMIILMILGIYVFVKYITGLLTTKNQKARTLCDLILSLANYIVAIAIILIVLSAFGVDTSTLIASAGILSLVIGLGCQTLISDIVAGLFIVFEGDFKVGDVVVINGWRGTVQTIGIRTTKIIDAAGNVNIVNNSSISNIINNTKELSIAICTCGIDYQESIERVEKIIETNLHFFNDRIPAIVNGPYYKGVEELGDNSVIIKLIAECKEEDKYQVQRDMNRCLKLIFDKNNVNIPFPQIVINKPVEPVKSKPVNMDDFIDSQREESKGLDDYNQ